MSGSLQAWYSLSDLESLRGGELVLSGELPLAKLTRLAGMLHADAGSVRASLRLRQRRDGWVAAQLDFATTVELVCQRCLEPFEQALAERVELVLTAPESSSATVPEGLEPIELENGRFLPAQLIEDELIVAVPLVPKHPRIEDCGSLARNLTQAN